MRRHHAPVVLALACLCVPAGATRAEAPEILSIVPRDAWIVVTLRDLNGIDARARKLMTDMKMIPISPLLYVKGSMLEIVEGVDDAGTAALVVLPTESGKWDIGGRDMVVLVPTTDRAKLTQFIKPQPLPDDPDYLKVTIKGQESFLGTRGKYSVIGASLDRVKAVVHGRDALATGLADHQIQQLAESDVCVLVRPAAMFAALSEPDMALVRGAATLGMSFEDLKATKTFLLSARLSEKGLRIEASTQRASAVEGPAERDGTLLRGLPVEKYVLAFGAAGPIKPWGPLAQYAEIIDKNEQINADRKEALKSAVAATWKDVQDIAVSIAALPEGPDGLVGVTVLVRTNGPAEETLRRIERLVTVMKEGTFIDPLDNAALARLSYRRGAEDAAGGAKIDHLFADLAGAAGVDESPIKRAIGREGVLVRLAVADDSLAVIGFGGGLPRFEAAVAAARAGDAKLAQDAGIAAAGAAIAPKRSMEGYLTIDRGLALARAIAKALDAKAPVPLMSEQPVPIVFAAHRVAPDTDGFEMFVPYATILAIKETATAAAAGMIGAAMGGR